MRSWMMTNFDRQVETPGLNSRSVIPSLLNAAVHLLVVHQEHYPKRSLVLQIAVSVSVIHILNNGRRHSEGHYRALDLPGEFSAVLRDSNVM